LCFAVLVGSAASNAAAQEPPDIPDIADIAGVYLCDGTGAGGEAYEGVVIIDKQGETFHVQWVFASEPVTFGVGILSGDALAVTYFGKSPGLILYKLDGKQLIGKWTTPGADGTVFSETLTPAPPDLHVEPSPRPWRPARRPVAKQTASIAPPPSAVAY
jgi:hypothetical protein